MFLSVTLVKSIHFHPLGVYWVCIGKVMYQTNLAELNTFPIHTQQIPRWWECMFLCSVWRHFWVFALKHRIVACPINLFHEQNLSPAATYLNYLILKNSYLLMFTIHSILVMTLLNAQDTVSFAQRFFNQKSMSPAGIYLDYMIAQILIFSLSNLKQSP